MISAFVAGICSLTVAANAASPGGMIEMATHSAVEIQDEVLALPGRTAGEVRVFTSPERADEVSSKLKGLAESVAIERRDLTADEGAEILAREGVLFESKDYGRPLVELVAGIGMPNLLNARVEVSVADSWSVGLGGGIGLLPAAVEATVRWTPPGLTLGDGKRNQLSLGLGPDLLVMPWDGMVAFILAGSVELEYLHWFSESFGFTIGTRWGLGATTEFGPSQSTQSFKIEPALNIVLLQLGIVVGKR